MRRVMFASLVRRHRGASAVMLALAVAVCWTATASAQLDPLSFVRRVPPTIIVVMDTSPSMLQDGNGNYYDPGYWPTTDATVTPAFTLPIGTKTYRRIFNGMLYGATNKYTSTRVQGVAAVWNPADSLTSNNATDLAFLNPTRYVIAKNGLTNAIAENSATTTRWGLVKLRQKNAVWRSTPGGSSAGGNDCDKPVSVTDPTQMLYGDNNPCAAGGPGFYGVYAPKVDEANYLQTGGGSPSNLAVVVTPGANTAAAVRTTVMRAVGDPQALIPAGIGGISAGSQFADRPLSYALDDAKAMAANAMSGDASATRSCRNTVVVLITAGKDSGNAAYLSANDVLARASSFTAVSGGGTTRRVPIHVIGVKVPVAEKAQLQSIATNSGGVYHDATTDVDVQIWIDYAVQAGYMRSADVDAPKAASEFVAVSPIVGTVNLTGGKDSTGTALPNDVIHQQNNNTLPIVPQRSDVMVTAAFELPGFAGRLRAFRVYKPVTDSTKPSGWRFENDGTKLWPDIDSPARPSLAGQARTPADPNTRNIYTYIPNGAGGGSMVAFTTANAATIAPAMNLSSTAASTLITFIRAQPLGAIIGSTPAMMDPPSLDPPPDDDYGRPDNSTTTFAGTHTNRRSIIFVGANDGMMHAIDARTGFEVWAYIPYNLLNKLRTLFDGQAIDTYEYFVDSSPKIAEVKVDPTNSNTALRWRTLLIFGEGPGGVFYQCFDVTEAGMGVDPTLGDISTVGTLLTKFDAPDEAITFKWAFPDYNHFDPTLKQTFTLTDGSPGGRITIWGDVADAKNATYAEKTVGLTWSDPAVGPLNLDRSTNAVIVGSGYFPPIETLLANRGGGSAPAAGNVLYVLNANTGALVGNASQTACSGAGCLSVGEVAGNNRKNAIQADPTAAGDAGLPTVKKAYVGDIDGKYWRFDFDATGALTKNLMADTDMPIYASSALLFVGTTDVYMFVATGSDILPPTTAGGTGIYRLYGFKDLAPASGADTKFAIDLATVSASGSLVTGERPSTSPTVAGDIVFYTTTVESGSQPCNDFSARLYAVTYSGSAAYDANANGKMDNNESNIVKTVAGRATAPFIVDQHLYFGTTGAGGAVIQAFGDPVDFNNGVGQVGVRILSWREIR